MSLVEHIIWKLSEVKSPNLGHSMPAITATIPYVPHGNRFQNISVYLHHTVESERLVGEPVRFLPLFSTGSQLPVVQVHIHGGAWRDPNLTSASIEAAVAHTFSATDSAATTYPITTVASINYTLSPFPEHPTQPYFNNTDNDAAIDPSRSAKHPQHIHDVLQALALLHSLGLEDNAYILSGHSAGACLAFQAALALPSQWGFSNDLAPPRPAAILGINGLYDLPDLVVGLGASHEHLQTVYAGLQAIAFGNDSGVWAAASPARFRPENINALLQKGGPRLVVLDQSTEDQLVPLVQTEKMEALLNNVDGLTVIRGHRCVGRHAAPWEEGYMVWEDVQDILEKAAQMDEKSSG